MLPGLKTGGVHKKLKDTIYPFRYNDFNGLKNLLKKNPEIGIIKIRYRMGASDKIIRTSSIQTSKRQQN